MVTQSEGAGRPQMWTLRSLQRAQDDVQYQIETHTDFEVKLVVMGVYPESATAAFVFTLHTRHLGTGKRISTAVGCPVEYVVISPHGAALAILKDAEKAVEELISSAA